MGQPKTGYGVVIKDKGIDIRTISPTRNAAFVNYLVSQKGIMVYQHDSHANIEAKWDAAKGADELCRVVVMQTSLVAELVHTFEGLLSIDVGPVDLAEVAPEGMVHTANSLLNLLKGFD